MTAAATTPRRRAFTLIELLIVTAIISILASIAVPNFLEAQTRAKVARVLNDERIMATALESYHVDFGQYPPRQTEKNLILYMDACAEGRTQNRPADMGEAEEKVEDLARLTTPISYLSQIPIDPFETKLAPPHNVLEYWDRLIINSIEKCVDEWAIVSVGPDGIMGQPSSLGDYPRDPLLSSQSFRFDYDPTNGTVSEGNIYRFQSQKPAMRVFLYDEFDQPRCDCNRL
ncbi:MAG: type II secretion system protein [Sumerlaeia bacterium]